MSAGRPREAAQQGGGDPRAALLEAMTQSCYERGYTDTSIEDLLRMAGVGRAEFDEHFPDKEACAVAAMEVVLAKGIAIVSTTFTGDMAEGESTLRALVGLLELFAERPAMGNVAMIDSRQRMPRVAYERYAGGIAILIAMLDRLRADAGGESEPPPFAAKAALGGAEALVRRELALGRAGSLPELAPDLIYSALVPFLGQEEALRIARQGRRLVGGDGSGSAT